MTQKQLIIEYIKLNGEILPAKMGGSIFMGLMFGSETSKRCRELRAKGILGSHQEGKFEVFFLTTPEVKDWFKPPQKPKFEVVGTIAGPYINQLTKQTSI